MWQGLAAFEAQVQNAERARQRGDQARAFELYRSILQQRLINQGEARATDFFTALDLVVIERTAELALLFGLTDASDALLAGMAALTEQAGNLYATDYTQIKRINLNLQGGQLQPAYQILLGMQPRLGDVRAMRFTQDVLESWENRLVWPGAEQADRHVIFSSLYLAMGSLLAALGQYRDALGALQQGLVHSRADAPPLARAAKLPLQLAIAAAHLEKGELPLASTTLEDAQPHLEETVHPGWLTDWLELSGKLHLLRGELGEAVAQLERVCELCQRRGFQLAALRARLSLAQMLTLLNYTADAQLLLLEVRDEARQIGNSIIVQRADTLLELTTARSHSLADGIPITPTVSQMRGVASKPSPQPAYQQQPTTLSSPVHIPQSPNYLAFYEDRALAFYWLLGRQNIAVVADYLDHIRQTFTLSDSTLIQTRLQILTGMLAYYQGDLVRAAQLLESARVTLRQMGLKPELWQLQRFLIWCATRLGHRDEAQRRLVEETETLLSEISASLSIGDRAVFQMNKWTAEEEYLASEIHQLAHMKKMLAASRGLTKLWRWWPLMKRLNGLMNRIDQYKTTLVQQHIGEPSSTRRVKRQTSLLRRFVMQPKDRITISFLVLPDCVFVTRSGWLSLDFGVSPLTRIQVRNAVRRWHEIASRNDGASRHLKVTGYQGRPATDPVKESQAIAAFVAEGLQISPILRELPKQIRAITLVPDDSLHGFPFSVIQYEGRYLIESFALATGFEWSGVTRNRELPTDRQVLLVGVSEGTGQWPPLPGVKTEMQWMTRWAEEHHFHARQLREQAAQTATVLASLPTCGLAHIACHGTFDTDRPDGSGLVLLDENRQSSVLTLRQLSALDLTLVQHVTLSSCWAADHFILPGRWVIGLPETVWRAGARSVLGSLWEVDDRIATALMARFYTYLDKHPRDEALRLAKIDCLHRNLPGCETFDTAQPVHWAGLNLYGDPGTLSLLSVRNRSHKNR